MRGNNWFIHDILELSFFSDDQTPSGCAYENLVIHGILASDRYLVPSTVSKGELI